jgi:hypothetical protein
LAVATADIEENQTSLDAVEPADQSLQGAGHGGRRRVSRDPGYWSSSTPITLPGAVADDQLVVARGSTTVCRSAPIADLSHDGGHGDNPSIRRCDLNCGAASGNRPDQGERAAGANCVFGYRARRCAIAQIDDIGVVSERIENEGSAPIRSISQGSGKSSDISLSQLHRFELLPFYCDSGMKRSHTSMHTGSRIRLECGAQIPLPLMSCRLTEDEG